MKFSFLQTIKNIYRDCKSISKNDYVAEHISNNVIEDEQPSFTSFYQRDFESIIKQLKEQTLVDFKLNDIDICEDKYQHLIIEGTYQSELGYALLIDDEEGKSYYTHLKIYYRPRYNNYLIEYYMDNLTYKSKSDYAKVLSFGQLMDFIYLEVEKKHIYAY